MAKTPKAEAIPEVFEISPPDLRIITTTLVGMSPLMVCRFSAKAMEQMRAKHEAGSSAKKAAKAARNFDDDFHNARHVSEDGWDGIHAAAFRHGLIDACRLVGFKMVLAKMSLFIEPDGFDRVDGVPLVRIIGGEPEKRLLHTRNATGVVDLRMRPMWREWKLNLRVKYDAQQFKTTDVLNLLSRVGQQIGVGEGRPFSKNSPGLGFGTFRLQTDADLAAERAA